MSTPQNPDSWGLIVGIEKYDLGEEWTLRGAVQSALNFSSLLHCCGVPPRNTLICLAPLEPFETDEQLKNARRKPATVRTVKTLVRYLGKKRATILYLFWAGHGMLKGDRRHLFVADSAAQEQTIELNSLLACLRDDDRYKGFPQQFVFIDACAIKAEKVPEKHRRYQGFNFGTEDENPESTKNQYVFFAAKKREVANYAEGFGQYSKELVQCNSDI
jgi:Caspase domain